MNKSYSLSSISNQIIVIWSPKFLFQLILIILSIDFDNRFVYVRLFMFISLYTYRIKFSIDWCYFSTRSSGKNTTSSIKTVFNSLFSLVFTVHLKILADIVIPRLQSYDISFIFKNHIKYVTFFKSAYIKTSISSLGDSTRREAYFSHIFKNIWECCDEMWMYLRTTCLLLYSTWFI